jgi:hypothetical protein
LWVLEITSSILASQSQAARRQTDKAKLSAASFAYFSSLLKKSRSGCGVDNPAINPIRYSAFMMSGATEIMKITASVSDLEIFSVPDNWIDNGAM